MSRKGFMPGCSLPSYSPINVEKTVKYLKGFYGDLSGIQKCCGKPTKALGQAEKFEERFGSLVKDIKDCEVDEMIVACQSCMNTLKDSPEFKTTSLWELMPQLGLPEEVRGKAKDSKVVFSVHDSCSIRGMSEIHDGIRWILHELGYETIEPEKTKATTRCCGFGGMIVPVNQEIAKKVMDRRVSDFPTEHVVTYCAACRQSITLGGGKAWHILDLIWGDVVHLDSEPPKDTLSSPVKAWQNRYKSKKAIKKVING